MVTIIEHFNEQPQHCNDANLPHTTDKSILYDNVEKNPRETENPSTQIATQNPNQVSTTSDLEWRAGRGEWILSSF